MTEPYPEQFRDCISDVLAMAEAYLMTAGTDEEKARLGTENFRFLMETADREGCLRVAIPLLASVWQLLSATRAQTQGTGADEEMASMLAWFRSKLGR